MYIAKDFPAKTPKTFNWLGLGFGPVAPKPETLNPEISQQCQAAKHRLHSDVIQHQPIVVPQFIRVHIVGIKGLCRDNGKENGNYYKGLGFGAYSPPEGNRK